VTRARLMAEKLGAPLAIIDKRRIDANVAEVMNVIGDVEGRDCVMVDDMIDTAGTLVKGADALVAHGATSVRACATHGLFSYDQKERISAYTKIDKSSIIEVIVTDSISQDWNNGWFADDVTAKVRSSPKIKTLSVAPLLAAGIRSIHEQTSVSRLFV
jgi:ribose-phosphate pyrophosphokinase